MENRKIQKHAEHVTTMEKHAKICKLKLFVSGLFTIIQTFW